MDVDTTMYTYVVLMVPIANTPTARDVVAVDVSMSTSDSVLIRSSAAVSITSTAHTPRSQPCMIPIADYKEYHVAVYTAVCVTPLGAALWWHTTTHNAHPVARCNEM